jgi:hypothetical protein
MKVFHSDITKFHLPAPISLLSFRVVNGVLCLRDSTFDRYKQIHGYGDGQEMFRLDNDYYRYWETQASPTSQGGAIGSFTLCKNCFGYAPHHLIDDFESNFPTMEISHGETKLVINSFGIEFHSLSSVFFVASEIGKHRYSQVFSHVTPIDFEVVDRLV